MFMDARMNPSLHNADFPNALYDVSISLVRILLPRT